MSGKNTNLLYALNVDGKMVHIDSVPNGDKCGCVCPKCKGKLCAKNSGNVRIHHFSHYNGVKCEGDVESALHIMAKEVLKEILCIHLPNISCPFYIHNELLYLDSVDIEVPDQETNLRPDCVGYYGSKKIWIEFKRTHAIDKRKIAKIKSANIDCIELDLNNCAQDYDAIRLFIKEDSEYREWINNSNTKHCKFYNERECKLISNQITNKDDYNISQSNKNSKLKTDSYIDINSKTKTTHNFIQREISRFSLLRNGEYKFDSILCSTKKSSESDIEYLYVYDNININKFAPKTYFLLKCYKQHKKAFFCAICKYKKATDLLYTYQNKQKEQFCPLEDKQLNCPYFILDERIVSENENNFEDIKVIER